MAASSRRQTARAVLALHPRSHADELGIDVARNTPAALYQWLLVSLLFSARIPATQAQKAAAALFGQGWRTPARMVASSWERRVAVLNRSGYARYDESAARYIGDTTGLLIQRYGGDLRRLRDAAGRDPAQERTRLKDFKGIGDVGADIFCREAQLAWEELYPFADRKALATASRLDLGDDAAALAALVELRDLPRLLSGLVRVGLHRQFDEVMRRAGCADRA
ncbi:hypothetical protein GCM10017083_46570 [Thalassobaculum fulvum]|uniref:Endonuclease n=1 Tax=Thalassobaculum fulvum TaxID=1633335 RepID=A0A918XW14_9PROT|nr:hypothetical protein [Thalassobaculum fulvum]GHD60547.1 hypothetical protein GCM10017083_46570 [Thalassobaculum fulvum]